MTQKNLLAVRSYMFKYLELLRLYEFLISTFVKVTLKVVGFNTVMTRPSPGRNVWVVSSSSSDCKTEEIVFKVLCSYSNNWNWKMSRHE